MKVKKFEARTEQEAIEMVKAELGLDALVLSIKKTQPKGFFAPFRKPSVEVTVAHSEKEPRHTFKSELSKTKFMLDMVVKADEQPKSAVPSQPETPVASNPNAYKFDSKRESKNDHSQKVSQLEKQLEETEQMLNQAMARLAVNVHKPFNDGRIYENNLIQIFYETLTAQGVTPKIAQEILEDVHAVEDDIDLTTIVKVVYQKLLNVLGKSQSINLEKPPENQPLLLIFIGPTGVGKTTTIAKLSSLFILNHGLKVGFITADTYRIAAVEQLKTYAEILNIDIGVVYNNEDLANHIRTMGAKNDVIMVDTAGRSHQCEETLKELHTLLAITPESRQFLVLSATTKYEDLLNIVNTYSSFTDFDIIFTKLDETACLGSILNICYVTGRNIAYVANGQNVPDDIESVQPEKLAKALLGLGGNIA